MRSTAALASLPEGRRALESGRRRVETIGDSGPAPHRASRPVRGPAEGRGGQAFGHCLHEFAVHSGASAVGEDDRV